MPNQDAMSSLLRHFSLQASGFFSGPLCQATATYGQGQDGHLHLLHQGSLMLQLADGTQQRIRAPALLLFATPQPHRLLPLPAQAAQLSCASLRFSSGPGHPLARALPGCLLLQGAALDGLAAVLQLLREEADNPAPGSQAVRDRLFEILLIRALRQLLQERPAAGNLLAGLADPRLCGALAALHAAPGKAWNLEALAACAQLSRARFAARFKQTLGCTPGEYLLDWRLQLVCQGLRQGQLPAVLAQEYGYANASALARAFRRRLGCSPRQWLAGLSVPSRRRASPPASHPCA